MATPGLNPPFTSILSPPFTQSSVIDTFKVVPSPNGTPTSTPLSTRNIRDKGKVTLHTPLSCLSLIAPFSVHSSRVTLNSPFFGTLRLIRICERFPRYARGARFDAYFRPCLFGIRGQQRWRQRHFKHKFEGPFTYPRSHTSSRGVLRWRFCFTGSIRRS